MGKQLQYLVFWKWQNAFFMAVAPKLIYQDTILSEKLKQSLFFVTLAKDKIPSHAYWEYSAAFLRHYPKAVAEEALEKREESTFTYDPKFYLKQALRVDLLSQWLFIPYLLGDLYKYYFLFKELHFGKEEFLFIDYWVQIPYVMTTVLEELTSINLLYRYMCWSA